MMPYHPCPSASSPIAPSFWSRTHRGGWCWYCHSANRIPKLDWTKKRQWYVPMYLEKTKNAKDGMDTNRIWTTRWWIPIFPKHTVSGAPPEDCNASRCRRILSGMLILMHGHPTWRVISIPSNKWLMCTKPSLSLTHIGGNSTWTEEIRKQIDT